LLLPVPLFLRRGQSFETNDGIRIPPRLAESLDSAKRGEDRRSYWQISFLWLSWVLLLISIAQPVLKSDQVALPATGRAIALAVDLSASMERKDFYLDDASINRFQVVKKFAGDFIEKRAGDRIALILFGKEAFVASPPSFDLVSVRHQLYQSSIGMAGRTTAIGDAIGLSIRELRDDPAPEKALILLSDGANNSGIVEPEVAARVASENGIRVHTIALGSKIPEVPSSGQQGFVVTSVSADLDVETLKSIARVSGGEYFRATTSNELRLIYEKIDLLESSEMKAPPLIVDVDIRDFFVVALIVSMLLYLWAGRYKYQLLPALVQFQRNRR